MSLIPIVQGGHSVASDFDSTLIGNSAWFNGADSRMDSPSFSAQSDPTCFTFATWVQINSFSVTNNQYIWSAERSGNYAAIGFDANDKLFAYSNPATFTSDMVFRDVGWYHIICSYKGATNTVRMFVNGVEITNTASNTLASPNPEPVAHSHTQRIGAYYVGATGGDLYETDAYLAQTVFLDGFSFQDGDISVSDFLDTFTFGTNGSQFIPKKDSELATLAGTAGANSYVLDYANSGSLGNDISSKNNNFTLTNLSSYNQSSNTPSLVYPRVNVLRPAISGKSFSEGALKVSSTSGFGNGNVLTTFPLSTGGYWYWEIIDAAASANQTYGIAKADAGANASGLGGDTKAWGFYNNQYRHNGNIGAVPDSPTNTGTRYMFAVDVDDGKFFMGNDGTWWKPVGGSTAGDPAAGTNPAFTDTDIAEGDTFPAMDLWSSDSATFVFDEDDFAHTIPTGFLPLKSSNLIAPTHQGCDFFQATAYTGNGTAIGSGGLTVNNSAFSPALVWIKNRDAADDHAWYDTQRGVTKQIESNTQTIESTEAEGLTAFTSTGFTVGNLDQVNTNTEGFIAWQWKAGTSFSGDGSGGAAGTVASSGVVAAPGHFSIFKFVANSGTAYTAKHGMSVAPEFFVVKHSGTGGSAWVAYTKPTASDAETDYMLLDTNGALQDDATVWNDTAPNEHVISIGTNSTINNSTNTMIGYAWRSVAGLCAVGSYTGNGINDGPHVSVGFLPKYVLVKSTTTNRNWNALDTTRNPINIASPSVLLPNDTLVDTAGQIGAFDILSDGFKPRDTAANSNASGETYFYLAMADIAGGGTLPPIYGR